MDRRRDRDRARARASNGFLNRASPCSSSAEDSHKAEATRPGTGQLPEARRGQAKASRRSRASRTERYLRRMSSAGRPRPLEPDDITDANFYARHTQVGHFCGLAHRPPSPPSPPTPPTPPSRDHSSRAFLDRHQRPSPGSPGPTSRATSNLEEALCELEAIYKSLQLGDEELLERAERRTMEEFLYKGLAAGPADSCPADASLAEQPDRLRDDMAYRRMQPKERPSSADGQSLSRVSYLMTCPLGGWADPSRLGRARGREPDAALDDVVFRSMLYANKTLKVVEPQPPFGIPLGPITAAAHSDYLHSSNPAGSQESARSPSREPDLVADDLAFRSLRKDAQPSGRQSSPCLLPPSTPSTPPLPRPFSLSTGKPAWSQEAPRISRAAPSHGSSSSSPCVESSDESDESTGPLRSPLADDRQPRASGHPPPARSLEPFSEHELSVYRQLCRDLENLVQLTQSSDSGQTAGKGARVSFEDVPTESSPTKLQISSILDGLNSLREESPAAGTVGQPNESSPSERAGGGGQDQVDEQQLGNRRRPSLASDDKGHWEGVNKCNHKYNSMPAKTSSLLMFRQYGSKRKSKNRKSICTVS